MTIENPRAWQSVLSHIENRLDTGELQQGDHLPAERTLAAELGVARSSVREAMRVLEVMGMLRTQTGSGPQSGTKIITHPTGGFQSLMRLQVAGGGFPVADVVETRLILEAAVVSALAQRVRNHHIDSPDLQSAGELLDAMDRPTLSRAEFLAFDALFHCALAESTGNSVIAATMAGIRSAIERYVRIGAETIADWSAMAERLREEHRSIIAAVLAGDEAEARTRIQTHITDYYRDCMSGSLSNTISRQP